jgi:hypothetical protein
MPAASSLDLSAPSKLIQNVLPDHKQPVTVTVSALGGVTTSGLRQRNFCFFLNTVLLLLLFENFQ